MVPALLRVPVRPGPEVEARDRDMEGFALPGGDHDQVTLPEEDLRGVRLERRGQRRSLAHILIEQQLERRAGTGWLGDSISH